MPKEEGRHPSDATPKSRTSKATPKPRHSETAPKLKPIEMTPKITDVKETKPKVTKKGKITDPVLKARKQLEAVNGS